MKKVVAFFSILCYILSRKNSCPSHEDKDENVLVGRTFVDGKRNLVMSEW